MKLQSYRAALSVSNVNEISRWYQDVLGFRFSRRMDFDDYGVHIEFLDANGFGLELIEKQGSKPKKELAPDLEDISLLHGYTKIGFLVDNINEVAASLKEKDVTIVYDVTDDPEEDIRWMIIKDPDGNIIQFFEKVK